MMSGVFTETNTTIYIVHLNDGKSATMLCMNGATLEEATASAIDRFSKERVASVEPRKAERAKAKQNTTFP